MPAEVKNPVAKEVFANLRMENYVNTVTLLAQMTLKGIFSPNPFHSTIDLKIKWLCSFFFLIQ